MNFFFSHKAHPRLSSAHFAFIFIFLAVTLFANPVGARENKTVKDIPYSTASDVYSRERCKLDVHYPTDTAGLPVVVWFHGGGLTKGSKRIPAPLKNKDIVVIAANYRLLPGTDVNGCIDDAAQAVAWAFRNAASYGGDPRKIVVAGHSAGAYLTSMVGLDKSRLAAYGIDADSIRALVPFSGQVITHFTRRKSIGKKEYEPLIDETAPMNYIRADAPPYIIITGDRQLELYGRYEENAYMWRLLKLAGHPWVELYEIGGHNHNEMTTPAHTILKKLLPRLTR